MKTQRSILFIVFLFVLTISFNSCSGEKYSQKEWEWEDPIKPEPKPEPEMPYKDNITDKALISMKWINSNDFGELPKYIRLYKSPEKLCNKKVRAYIVVADMQKATFEVLNNVCFNNDANGYVGTKKKPDKFYSETKDPVIVNGGLFFTAKSGSGKYYTYSQSLIYSQGKMKAPNINYYSKDWKTIWYPTIGAFGQRDDGSFFVTYTYYNNNDKKNYSYSKPANNNIENEPLQVPDANYPEIAVEFKAKNAIGGVGVLLKDGQIKNTYIQEMLDVAASSNQPRTAIASAKDGSLILFVCEGRNKEDDILGLTTEDIANIFKELKLENALNLDGGGSTCMLINGKSIIKVSDKDKQGNAVQRPVLAAIGLK